jgi:hypothetical protein
VVLRSRTSMLSPTMLDATNARKAACLNLEATFTTIDPDTRRPKGGRREPHYCLDDPLSPDMSQSSLSTVTDPGLTSSSIVPTQSVLITGTWCSESTPRVSGVGWP